MLGESEVASDDVLEQTHRGGLQQLRDHAGQHEAQRVEALRRGTDVGEARVVQQDLLNDEGGDCLRQFRSGLHNPQTQRNNLSLKQKVHNFRVVNLH